MVETSASTLAPVRYVCRMARIASHRAPGNSRSNSRASDSSGLHCDLDARRATHTGPVHGLAQLVAARETLRLLDAREAVNDEHVVLVTGIGVHLSAGAAVLLSQWLDLVVHRAPRGVVVHAVPGKHRR